MSNKPFQSKLTAYQQEIMILRKSGISYGKIVQWLRLEKGVNTGKTTLYSFVLRRQNKLTAGRYKTMDEINRLVQNVSPDFPRIRLPDIKTHQATSTGDVSQIDIRKILNSHK